MDKHRRQDERRRARVKARVSAKGSGESVSGFTRDLSRGGVFVQTRKPFAQGTAIKVQLLYPEETVELEGVVVRALRLPGHLQGNQASGMGIRFPDSTELARVAGLQRKARIALGSDVVVFFGSERLHLELHDLSISGAALLSPTDLPVTGFLRIHFKLSSTGEVLELEGVPVSTRPHDGQTLIGVDFIDPSPESVARIEALIAERRGGEEE